MSHLSRIVIKQPLPPAVTLLHIAFHLSATSITFIGNSAAGSNSTSSHITAVSVARVVDYYLLAVSLI